MQFRKISFYNFGLLAGEQTLDLSTGSQVDGKASIVLIGGQNGAGKTTILEALRLCLYGRLAFGTRSSVAEYQQYLINRIHRPKGGVTAPDTASVLLEFELTAQDKTDIYQIQRSWTRKSDTSNSVGEKFEVYKNGNMLDDVEADYWQEFIQGLIPSGLSQLFFFDGEQIQQLANDDTDSSALAGSVKALLGLEIVERLHTDLSIYTGREIKRNQSKEAADQIAAAHVQMQEAEEKINLLKQERASLENNLGRTRMAIEECERRLMQAGKGFFDDREKLKNRKADIEATTAQLEKRLAELCEEELPFSLCPTLCEDLRLQLQAEHDLQRWEGSRDEVKHFADTLMQRAASKGFANGAASSKLSNLVATVLEESQEPPPALKQTKVLHGVSAADKAQLDSWIQRATDTLPNTAREVVNKLEKRRNELRKTQKALSQVPEQDLLKPLMESLFGLQRNLAELEAKDLALEGQISEVTRSYEMAKRQMEKGVAESYEARSKDRQLAYAVKTQEALREFQGLLTEMKLRRLEREFVHTFNFLSRKLELSEVKIEPETFLVTMTDDDGNILRKSQFSAGEKQIYAVAMLWTLAKISGRPLPVVIDTPLGRLDTVHRSKLLERYFPNASHQVIILSTDTEVDQAYFDLLQPHVARTYHLVHDRKAGMTRAEEGYFWKEKVHA